MTRSDRQPDAIALLKADHREIEALFEKYEAARGRDRKKALAEHLCTLLKIHTVLEEEILYPACRERIPDSKLDEGYVEHDAAKVLIQQIEAGGPDEHFYDAKVHVLSEMLEHHFKEEETPTKGIFSLARHAGLDMDELGDRMRTRQETARRELGRHPELGAETRTFEGDDVDSALADEPIDPSGPDIRTGARGAEDPARP